MKRKFVNIIILIFCSLILFISCQADSNIPVYQLSNERKGIDHIKPIEYEAKYEYTNDFIQASYLYHEPSEDNMTNYVSLTDDLFYSLQEKTDHLVSAYYNINLPYSKEESLSIVKQDMDSNLYQTMITDSYIQDRFNLFEKYQARTIVSGLDYLPYNLVKKNLFDENNIRLWVRVNSSTFSSNNEFYAKGHYVKGALLMELYVYFSKNDDGDYRIYAIDEVNINPDLEVIYTSDKIKYNSDPDHLSPKDFDTPPELVNGYELIQKVVYPTKLQNQLFSNVEEAALLILDSENENDKKLSEIKDLFVETTFDKLVAENSLEKTSQSISLGSNKAFRLSGNRTLYAYSTRDNEFYVANISLSQNINNGNREFIFSAICLENANTLKIKEFQIYDKSSNTIIFSTRIS